jgi:hypothetical protein
MSDFDDAVERLIDEAQAQGFPRRVKDPAALARIAALVKQSEPVSARKKKAKEARTSGTFAT